MATEKNNTEIAKVYCIATFINCQEEKLDKDYADKRKKAHAWKWKMKQAWSYVIEDFLNNTYDHTVFWELIYEVVKTSWTVDYIRKHLWPIKPQVWIMPGSGLKSVGIC